MLIQESLEMDFEFIFIVWSHKPLEFNIPVKEEKDGSGQFLRKLIVVCSALCAAIFVIPVSYYGWNYSKHGVLLMILFTRISHHTQFKSISVANT